MTMVGLLFVAHGFVLYSMICLRELEMGQRYVTTLVGFIYSSD